jgi:hypothetical protein
MDRGVAFATLRLFEKELAFCRFAAIATKTISPGRVIRLEYGRSNLGTYLIEDTGSPTRSTGRAFVLDAPVIAKFFLCPVADPRRTGRAGRPKGNTDGMRQRAGISIAG